MCGGHFSEQHHVQRDAAEEGDGAGQGQEGQSFSQNSQSCQEFFLKKVSTLFNEMGDGGGGMRQ